MKIVIQLRAGDEAVLDEELVHVSPLLHQHVMPNGTHRFTSPKPGDDIAYNTSE